MGIIRKLAIGVALLVAVPTLLMIFRLAQSQYHLVTMTHTMSEISPHDPVFSSPSYQRYFGGRRWAKIESFGSGIAISLATVRPELRTSPEVFAAEVFRLLWNSRMSTQFNGPPSPQPPGVGAVSASDSIRAEVVEANPTDMTLTITTIATGFTGGLEVIQVLFNHEQGAAGVLIKYIWHNDVVLPRKWYQYLSIWLQLTGRRIWLMNVLNNVGGVGDGYAADQGQEQEQSSPGVKAEL
ncbi:hypothetical protein GGR52DRAFT_558599 [Hypoxylon sp. FL1284]|nr:hypothetical protein GGR52DRAFT_558599 [Hypoxylon sp. FL1284]